MYEMIPALQSNIASLKKKIQALDKASSPKSIFIKSFLKKISKVQLIFDIFEKHFYVLLFRVMHGPDINKIIV